MKTSKILACLSAAAFAGSMLSMISFAEEEASKTTFDTITYKLNYKAGSDEVYFYDDANNATKLVSGENTITVPHSTPAEGIQNFGYISGKDWAEISADVQVDVTGFSVNGFEFNDAQFLKTLTKDANGLPNVWNDSKNSTFTSTNDEVKIAYDSTSDAFKLSDASAPEAINVDLPLSKEGMNAQAVLILRSESAKVEEENPQMQDGGWENINKMVATVRVSDAYAKSGEWYGGAVGVNVKRNAEDPFAKGWTQLGTFDNTTLESLGNNLYTITYTAPEGKTLWTDGENGAEGIGEDPCIQLWVAHWQAEGTEFANAGQTDFAVMNISAYDANGLVISANNTTPDPLPEPTPEGVECPCGCGCTAETCKVWDKEKQCCGCGCSEAVKIDGEVTLFDGTTATWNNAETASPFSINGDGEYEIKLNTKAWDDIETPIALNPKNLAGDNGGTDMVFCLDFLDAMVDTGETETRKDREGNDNTDAKKYDKVYPDFDVEITDILANDKSIFDASKATGIVKGNTEDNGKYRVSLFNSWNKFENNDPDKTGLTLPTTNITDLTIKIKVAGLGSMSGKCKCQATKGIDLTPAKTEVVENTRAFEATGKYGFVFKGDTTVGEGVADTDVTFSVDKPEALAVSAPAADAAAATAGEGETTGVTVKTDKDGNAIVELKPGEVSEDTDVVLTATAADGTTASTTIKVKNKAAEDTTSSEDPEEEEGEEPEEEEEEEEEETSSTTSSTASSSTASTAAATTASAGATDNNPATGAAALGTVGLLLAGAALAVSKKKD